jgi:hypothetical protein
MIMASVDLYWIGKRFGVNSNTKAVGEHYMNITTKLSAPAKFPAVYGLQSGSLA